MSEELLSEEKKEKIKKWTKNTTNILLVLVIIFAVLIRVHYFFMTSSQPLWWDEAAYGSLAKNHITHEWDNTKIIQGETNIRPPLFPILWSILLRLGFGEPGVRFLLELVPSILAVLGVYFVGKEAYNKKTGIIAAFIFSTLWIHLFYTSRLLTNVPSLPFIFFSIFYFIKAFKSEFQPKYFSISLILLGIATLIRYPHGLIFFAYLIFIILSGNFKLIKKKSFWASGIAGISPILLFFAYNYLKYKNIFPAVLGNGYVEAVSEAFAFSVLNYIPVYLKTVFFIAFLIGTAIAILELILAYDKIKSNTKLKSHLLLILTAGIILAYFIFSIRGAEDRWLFPISISLSIFAAFGLTSIQKFINPYSKNIAIAVILILLTFGAYSQITFAEGLIKNKKESFLQIRQGFEWLGENSPHGGYVIGQGIEVYAIYYAEKTPIHFYDNYTSIPEEADYAVLHAFRPQSENFTAQLNENEWSTEKLWFFDKENQKLAFALFKKRT